MMEAHDPTNTTGAPTDNVVEDGVLPWKIGFLFLTLAIAGLFTGIPFILKQPRFYNWLGLAKTFGGGVFLGIAFINLLPELFLLKEPLEDGLYNEFPLGFFIALASYVLLLVVTSVTPRWAGGHGHSHGPGRNMELDERSMTLSLVSLEDGENDEAIEVKKSRQNKTSVIGSLALLGSLFLHGFMDGLIIGIQFLLEEVMSIGFAIVAHKWAEALTFGIIMLKLPSSTSKICIWSFILIFVVSTPIGVGVGILLSAEVSIVFTTIVNAIAVGVFVFIAIHEILIHEFSRYSTWISLKAVCLLLGVVVAAVLRASLPHSHEHDHDHDHDHEH